MSKQNLVPIQIKVTPETKQKYEDKIHQLGYVTYTEELRGHIRQLIEEA